VTLLQVMIHDPPFLLFSTSDIAVPCGCNRAVSIGLPMRSAVRSKQSQSSSAV
jgi:hypothetical protein